MRSKRGIFWYSLGLTLLLLLPMILTVAFFTDQYQKQQLLRFLCGIGFSGMEQHFHAGDVGFPVQRRRGHDRAGDFVPDSVCSCRIFAFDCKKSVEQKIVSQLFLYIFLDFSGTRLGYDL